jgi:predicted dehydrogenase
MRKGAAKESGKEILRAAIIGCGFIAGLNDIPKRDKAVRSHAKAYWLEPRAKLVAVADRDSARAREFASRWRVPRVYRTARTLMEAESPDIVSICTPDETHLDVFEECVGSPGLKAIWCEKPLGTDIRRAERLVQICQERGIVIAVNYQRRWDPLVGHLRQVVQEGKLGDLQRVVVYYGKGILHNGSHAIDLLLDWLGRPQTLKVTGKIFDFVPGDPTVDAWLKMKGVPVFLIGVDSRHYSLFEMDFLGTKGRAILANFGRRLEWFPRENSSGLDQAGELREPPMIRRRGRPIAMRLALAEILHATQTGCAVLSSGQTALESLRLCRKLADLRCEWTTITQGEK